MIFHDGLQNSGGSIEPLASQQVMKNASLRRSVGGDVHERSAYRSPYPCLQYRWRSHYPALWRSLPRSRGLRLPLIVGFNDGGVQPSLDEGQDRSVHDPHAQALEQLIVRNRIEVALQVCVVYFAPARLDLLPDLGESVVRRAARTEPVRAVDEVCLEDRLQNQKHRHLHNPVPNGRNAQRSLPAVRLGYIDAFHRLWPIATGTKFLMQLPQEGCRARTINDVLA